MASTHPQALRFDDVEIDVAGRRLLRAGTQQSLEPKAFDVLLLLAGAPGQAFGRDQILDAVWGHRHVTPGVLNRVMTLLRQALGEDAQHPHYLHTLHGIGYRFDLPAPVGPAGRAPEPAAAMAEHAGGLPPVAPGPAVHAVPDASPGPRPVATGLVPARPRPAAWWLAAVAATVLAVLASGWHVTRGNRATVAGASAPTLIVMPLRPIGGGPADRDIAAGLSDELISALARIDGLHVIARESTGLAVAESTDLTVLVPRLGISHALEGSLRQSGQALRMHVRLTDVASGRTLWAQDYDRDVVDVLALEREIAAAVARSLALRLGLATAPPHKGGDAGFLRRYQRVRLHLRGVTTAETLELAEAELRELASLRPADARVRAELAFALDSRAGARPQLADGLRAEAHREAALALRLDPNLPEPYHVLATQACRDRRWDACLALHEQALAMDPSAAATRMTYAMGLASMGYLERARRVLHTGLVKDPLNKRLHYAHGRLLDTLGDHVPAQAAYAKADGFNLYGPWFNAVWRHDHAEALRIAGRMDDNPRDPENGPLLKKTHLAATRALADPRLWPAARAEGLAFERRTGLMDFLRVLHPEPDTAALIAGFDRVRTRGYSTWDLLLWTRDLAYIRRDPAFHGYLRRNGILAHWARHGAPPQCRLAGEAATCE